MPDDLDEPARAGLGDIPRPLALPGVGERLRDWIEQRGIAPLRLFGGAAISALLVAVGWWILRPPEPPIDSLLPVESSAPAGSSGEPPAAASGEQPAASSTAPPGIVAHAAGAVARPGVYQLANGARVADLLAAAGGPAPDADEDRINLAALLVDGQRVYLLRVDEAAEPVAVGGASASPVASGPTGSAGGAAAVDLNTATATELDTLPGVGPSTAAAIIDYREQNGLFSSVDELLEVRGIGEAKLESLRDQVRV